MDRNAQKIQDALKIALEAIRDYEADPNIRAMLHSKVKEAQLIHKGSLRD